MHNRKNNFDLIRHFAALLVIFCHSYGFDGRIDPIHDRLGFLSGGQMAVYIFFTLSGYLLTDSWLRTPDLIPYFYKRILRIFPALIVVVLLTIFVFGPVLSYYSLADYFSSPKTYSYLQNLTLWKLQFGLPGCEMNGSPITVNGCMWTLFFEFMMYILLPLFAMSGMLNKSSVKSGGLIAIILVLMIFHIRGIPADLSVIKILVYNYVRLFIYFYSGVLYRVFLCGRFIPGVVLLAALTGMVFLRATIFAEPFALLFIISFVFHIGFYPLNISNGIFRGNDYSYGIYLYGFIGQNIIAKYIGDAVPLSLKIFFSVMFAVMFAFCSWHLVEKKSLQYKSAYNFLQRLIYR